jgi:ABC-type transport system involved in multi-copper enzyme maturation permease subunit
MANVWLLAWNSFEEAFRRKVMYVLLFVALLFGTYAAYQMVYMGMAANAGELQMLADLRGKFVQSLFGMMEFFSSILAVFLGSVALSTELRTRTIVPVLSRPVGRISFFFAKWLGNLAFLGLFLGCGVLAGIAIAAYWELQPSPLFFLGILQIFLGIAVLSSLSLGLSSRFHPVLAGGFAVMLVLLPSLTEGFSGHTSAVLRSVALVARYLAPARLQESLLENGLLKGVLSPDYRLYLSVLAENALYAFAAVLAGALVFRRRELTFK